MTDLVVRGCIVADGGGRPPIGPRRLRRRALRVPGDKAGFEALLGGDFARGLIAF